MILPLFLLLTLSSCSEPKPPVVQHTAICGREEGQPIYQALVPLTWRRIGPASHQNLSDTTLPICSFEAGNILITVHNFPYTTLDQRVPPLAQVARWKEQFQIHDGDVTAVSHGGFGGFRLEAHDPNGKGMIAYAMQMTPALFRMVENPQIKADYTIKAVGPSSEIEAERKLIDSFANSFELIHPIESPL